MRLRFSISRKPCGFTLIEVLLALVLTGALLSAAGMIAVQSAQANQSARQYLEKSQSSLRALDQFQSDLQDMITWLPQGVRNLAVRPVEGTLLEVITLSDWPDLQSAMRRRNPSRVRYRLQEGADENGTRHLVREVDDLTDEGGPRTHIVARRLNGARLEALVNETWVTEPSPTDEILGVRLTLTWKDAPELPWIRTVTVPRLERLR